MAKLANFGQDSANFTIQQVYLKGKETEFVDLTFETNFHEVKADRLTQNMPCYCTLSMKI